MSHKLHMDMEEFIVPDEDYVKEKRKWDTRKSKSCEVTYEQFEESIDIFGTVKEYSKKLKRLRDQNESGNIATLSISKEIKIVNMGSTNDNDDEDEANWISMKLGIGVPIDYIRKILQLINSEKLDLAFIAMYKYLESPSLEGNGSSIIWDISNLNKIWLAIHNRRNNLLSTYKRADQSLLNVIKEAKSIYELDDVQMKLNLYLDGKDREFKSPLKKSEYHICKDAGLQEIAKEFGLMISIEEIEAVRRDEDAKETPQQMASRFRGSRFDNDELVLQAATRMAAFEISCDPSLRKHVRKFFMDNAVVSSKPTNEGNCKIHKYHWFAQIKWLKEKPLHEFKNEEWFLIENATKEKLLKVRIHLPTDLHLKLIDKARGSYLSYGKGLYAELWDEKRKRIIDIAFSEHLLPLMEKEAKIFLRSIAKNWVLLHYRTKLWQKLSFTQRYSYQATPRVVMSCCTDYELHKTTFVILDSYGELLSQLCVNLKRNSLNRATNKDDDCEKLVNFMRSHKPQIIVVGGDKFPKFPCLRLKNEIMEITKAHGIVCPPILYEDETLPRLYENSIVSTRQFPSESGNTRRAVALGRYLQSPLAMVATLCTPPKDILQWELSPFQTFLLDDEVYGMVEQVMVDATKQQGLHINVAKKNEWLLAIATSLQTPKIEEVDSNNDNRRECFNEYDQLHKLDKLYGEKGQKLKGTHVRAKVVWINRDTSIVCLLESGMKGMIYKENTRCITSCFNPLKTGDIITCKIVKVKQKECMVELVPSRTSVNDQYNKINHEEIDKEDQVPKLPPKENVYPRLIKHPSFENFTSSEALKHLCDKETGAFIIYPSSRGPSYLTLTIKILDNFYTHEEIWEEREPGVVTVNRPKCLRIREDTFEDIDNVISMYVDPMVLHLKKMLGYSMFSNGEKVTVHESLKMMKSENPSQIVYSFRLSCECPGLFILEYIPSGDLIVCVKPIQVDPKGFTFESYRFNDFGMLVAHIERYIQCTGSSSSSRCSVSHTYMGLGGGGRGRGGGRGHGGGRGRGGGRSGGRGRGRGRGGGGGRGRGSFVDSNLSRVYGDFGSSRGPGMNLGRHGCDGGGFYGLG